MAVSLLLNARQALAACVWLLLAAPLAWAEAPATASPKATEAAPPAAAAKAPAPSQPPAAAPAAAQPTATSPAPAAAPEAALPGSDLPDPFAPQAATEEPESIGWTLLRTGLLLIAVLASIYLTLNVGLRRLMGLQGAAIGRQTVVSVLERVPIDQRRALLVLKAADEYLLVGSGEGGLQLLSKLDTQAVERIRAERPQPSTVIPLSPFLQKLLSRRTGSTPPRS